MFTLKTTSAIPDITKRSGRPPKYPFNKMGVDTDNSFVVDNEKDVKKVRSAIQVYKKNNPTKDFTVRRTAENEWLVIRTK